jgi:hypothetical protein
VFMMGREKLRHSGRCRRVLLADREAASRRSSCRQRRSVRKPGDWRHR